jgi:hypothetical protein
MTIWYILYSFGDFFPVLVSCTKKNLATLFMTAIRPTNNKIGFFHDTISHDLFCGVVPDPKLDSSSFAYDTIRHNTPMSSNYGYFVMVK